MLHAIENAPRFVFFTGKGGVGKTSLACATAVALADAGKRVLLTSTDPASNVGQVFGQSVGTTITPVTSVEGLSAVEVDPNQAAADYRDRIVGPVRGVLPQEVLDGIEEQLSGGCTTEIAAFDEFTSLLTDERVLAEFDHVVFDTAPTGHTIRMLQLPAAWTGFIESADGAVSSVGPLAGLAKNKEKYARAVDALADPAATRLVLVSRAQSAALGEAARTAGELAALGISEQYLVVNGILPADAALGDPIATAVHHREVAAMADEPEALRGLVHDHVALRPANVMGVDALRALLSEAPSSTAKGAADGSVERVEMDNLADLVEQIAADRHGLIMTMGKGGVGKTTLAAAIAVALARRGLPVHLTTSDPAAHLQDAIGEAGDLLKVSRIDPDLEREQYKAHVMATRGAGLDEAGLAVLAEDLESPCTEEIAVLHAFSAIVAEAKNSFVVMDTAPTGHTLLLLDAAGAYHREAVRQLGTDEATLNSTLGTLQDPATTRMIITTLPEATPVMEATALQDDLRRAGIEPWAWVVNQSLNGLDLTSPLLRTRARAEVPLLHQVRDELATRSALVPLQSTEPRGVCALAALSEHQPARV
ncbi:arsenical pump-driving ATPase [Oerskovia turbata]|uniref:Arsenical pump-driving ATPase n=1 Tax=Oerskovia turbata TaxID=1713 RepID=A0A4Q1KXJ5_9CELL|nr:arsenical pump-driving ATPase [Oerskovia turbata]RXR24921.1 arsenical pump-driving ATPase [Oerskovia turbata]RXR35071.1 arsenical pump-driving ATPase [Oerskovia turbata]TGJ98011.1 arsenical pump-driving ATPase [Actinotalea fermentans ATCC 43279 = JCM 9966 = DSM 3133]